MEITKETFDKFHDDMHALREFAVLMVNSTYVEICGIAIDDATTFVVSEREFTQECNQPTMIDEYEALHERFFAYDSEQDAIAYLTSVAQREVSTFDI